MKNIIEVLGCYSPNIRFRPVSMYKVFLESKIVYLDMGYGNASKVDLETIDKAIIVISHNHIDHAAGILELALLLRCKKVELKNRINVYLPNSLFYFNLSCILSKKSKYFNFHYIDENTSLQIDNYNITFCSTIHKGESYAIKFVNNTNLHSFAYTSDIAVITKKLIDFCYKVDILLMEGGRPENGISLKNYHATTNYLLKNINKARPCKILITHLKVASEERCAYDEFCVDSKVSIVGIAKKYSLF